MATDAIPTPISRERTRWPGGEGYDRMDYARARGWSAIPSWGREGWDLGSWPLIVVYHRKRETTTHGDDWQQHHEVAVDVEGDIDIECFASKDDRDRRTDEIALFYWKVHGDEWARGVESAESMPEHLRGPFAWARLEA